MPTTPPPVDPPVVYRRPPLHTPELVGAAVIALTVLAVTVLDLFGSLDPTVVSSVLVGAIGWASGGTAGYRLGTRRASDLQAGNGDG